MKNRRFLWQSFLFHFTLLLFLSCMSTIPPKSLSKMDVALKREMHQPDNPSLNIIGTSIRPIAEKERLIFSKYKIELRTVTGERFTAYGRKKGVQRLANEDWIIHLELSKKVYPLKE